MSTDRHTHWSLWLLLALAWFATLGWRPLFEPDEGRYAEIPREMRLSGDWVTPRLNGYKYFEKPALQYWATTAAYALFGTHEWTSRLWSSALAFLCVPLVYAFARRLYRSQSAGIAAASALALNPYFVIVGQINLLDAGLCFFLTAAVFAFLVSGDTSIGSRAERRWMMCAAACLGLAVLSKGPVALLLPGVTAVFHAAATRSYRPFRRWHLVHTVPIFVLISVPWFVVVSLRNPDFPRFFFIHEHVERFLTDGHGRVEPWWFFIPCIVLATLPWMISLVRGVAVLAASPIRCAWHSSTWFLAIYCVVIFVFFSASHSKLAPYVMPMMPALAVLLAPYIANRNSASARAAWVIASLFTVLGVGLCIAAARESGSTSAPMIGWVAAATVAIVSASWMTARVTRDSSAFVSAAVGAMLSAQGLLMAFSHYPPGQSAKALVADMRPFIGPHTEIFSVDQYRQSIPPYLGRTVRLVRYRGEMDFGIDAAGGAGFIPTLEAFADSWQHSTDALAIVDLDVMDTLRAMRLPFELRAVDGRSAVITRAGAHACLTTGEAADLTGDKPTS